jgi:hypothetical protein
MMDIGIIDIKELELKTASEIVDELPPGHVGGIREAERILRAWLNGRRISGQLFADAVCEYICRTRNRLSECSIHNTGETHDFGLDGSALTASYFAVADH